MLVKCEEIVDGPGLSEKMVTIRTTSGRLTAKRLRGLKQVGGLAGIPHRSLCAAHACNEQGPPGVKVEQSFTAACRL